MNLLLIIRLRQSMIAPMTPTISRSALITIRPSRITKIDIRTLMSIRLIIRLKERAARAELSSAQNAAEVLFVDGFIVKLHIARAPFFSNLNKQTGML